MYLMKNKDEVPQHFKDWKAMVEKQSECRVKTLRSDNGGEYMSTEFEDYLRSEGITHQTSVPYSPQQNGVAERFNGTLLEATRSLLHGAKLSKEFWGEGVMAANYLKNRSPHRGLEEDITPMEAYTGIKPYVGHLRAYGCTASVLIPDVKRNKLDPKSWRGIFVGYATSQRAYRIWKKETREVYISRDVIFHENEYLGEPAEEGTAEPEDWEGDFRRWKYEEEPEETQKPEEEEVTLRVIALTEGAERTEEREVLPSGPDPTVETQESEEAPEQPAEGAEALQEAQQTEDTVPDQEEREEVLKW